MNQSQLLIRIIYSKKQDKIFSCTGTLSNPFFRIFSVPKARYKDDMIVVDERASNIIANRNIFYQLGEKNIVDKLFKDLTEYITPNVPLVSLTNVPDISLLNVPLFTGCN